MKKSVILSACMIFGISAFAGLADHPDWIAFPNVNVDAHLLKIARHYYPDASPDLPRGIPLKAAWKQDVEKAAQGLNVPEEELRKFTDFVVTPQKHEPVAAPHPKLREFELFARGKRAIFFEEAEKEIPSAWQELLALPVEQRFYTTIPTLYCMDRRVSFQNIRKTGYYLPQITAARKQGCIDTQGVERALISDVDVNPYDMETDVSFYDRLLREFALNYVAEKAWRYCNDNDIWRWATFRGDRFFSGEKMPPLRFNVYLEKEEHLRELCQKMPALRDFVVALGLTNRQMLTVRKLAFEFAPQSPLNYPVWALRLPLAEAEKVLADKPEHARLLAQLRLKQLSGAEKIKAIDDHLAKYPDYTPEEMPVTSVALLTHGELQAFAGLEYYKMHRYHEALERWLKSGTPEDVALIAEQIFTTQELIDFCKKHYSGKITASCDVTSLQCAGNNKAAYPNLLAGKEIEYLLRNVLARRLMREKRYAEAREWFTGNFSAYYAELFFQLKAKLDDPKLDRQSKLESALNLATLIRFHGDFIFGTFLEPDNVICLGTYPCSWGTTIPNPDLHKPKLPRFHYRWIAAERYRAAAELTDNPQLKGFCFWMAGTLLKYRDAKRAEADYKALVKICPDLIEKNWFKKLRHTPETIQNYYRQQIFAFGGDPLAAWKPEMPEIEKTELPPNDGTVESLLKMGRALYEKADSADSQEFRQAAYAFYLAGKKGSAEGYFWCGVQHFGNLSRNVYAAAFFKKALELNPAMNKAKHELGRTALELGLWKEGVALIRHVAETEKADKELIGFATFNLFIFHRNGHFGVPQDEEKAVYYLKKSAEAGLPQAIKILKDRSGNEK